MPLDLADWQSYRRPVGVVSSRDFYHQVKIERKTPGLCYSLLVNREMVQLKRFVPLKILRKKKRLQNWYRLKKTKYSFGLLLTLVN